MSIESLARRQFTANLMLLSQFANKSELAEQVLVEFVAQCVMKYDRTGVVDLEEQSAWTLRVAALTEQFGGLL